MYLFDDMMKNEFAHFVRPTATILLANGFDETWIEQFLLCADLNGWEHCLVGLTDAPVYGDQGNFRPIQFTLSQMVGHVPQLLVIPEGDTCLKHLFVDPHVHVLIQNTLDGAGKVALSHLAELHMRHAHVRIAAFHENIYFQRNATIAAFANQIMG